ncbi:hypothetical protein MZ909_06590 [Thermosynechococcus sp. B0]|uniref:hypothetical protein n=1 Tax=Thermosynechococcus sp. B0 TaxID=2937284 RepID=UPI002576FA80|nr:hypothetical protein [Thermosynechococcus sp. B0]WJI25342.1 hypothetical protein MZ909_06590 [Thermosynechococcus sp. B0]
MTKAYTPDDVWRLLGELLEAQKETERHFQETERRFQETERRFQETERRFQETDRRFQETDRRFQETDRRFQETERLLREEARQLNQQLGKLGNRLGEFVEWQVRPAVLRLFQSRGIAVSQLYSDVILQDGNESLEIDLLVVNTNQAVLVEVKTKLSQGDVDEHLERIAKFRRLAHQYRDTQLLGAVAGMIVPPEVARYAYRQGLFVLAQSGDGVAILNDAQFQPRTW